MTRADVPWAVATSGRPASAQPMLELLKLGPEVPVITRDQVDRAKPDPDLFLAFYQDPADLLQHSDEVGVRDAGRDAAIPHDWSPTRPQFDCVRMRLEHDRQG